MKNIFLLNAGLLVLHPKECCIVLCHQAQLIMIYILLMSFIYLIPCCGCSLEYVGEVGKKINKRFNWYKSCFNNPKNIGFHFLISRLKPSRDILFLISEGICFQIFGPKYDTDSVPL